MSKPAIRRVTEAPRHHFFGYYDKCPWDVGGRRILGLEAAFLDRLPGPGDRVSVGFVRPGAGERFEAVSDTGAWNWQQGAMLQWLGPDHQSRIVFNDREGGSLGAVVLEIATGVRRRLEAPVYSVHPSGRRALTLNFARLFDIRTSYGYPGVVDPGAADAAPADDGVFVMDLESGRRVLLFSLAELVARNHLSSMQQGKHWVDHLTYNIDGSRFCFLHRWQLADGGFYHRLYAADEDGGNLTCLLDSGYFSHFGWHPNGDLLGYGRLPNALTSTRRHGWVSKRVLKPLLPLFHRLVPEHGDLRRRLIRDHYLAFEPGGQIRVVGKAVLDQDGHCTWSPDGRWILTDTYPDAEQKRTLILFRPETGRRIDVGRFHAVPGSDSGAGADWLVSGMRCDLHPRWNRDGTQVCIDSVHEGTRQMYVVDVQDLVRN